MRLTIGTTSYNNYAETYATIEALRTYHDLTDCEILVIDNFGDHELEEFIKSNGSCAGCPPHCGVVRYVKCVEKNGPAYAKNKVFEHARGEMTLCVDSHVFLAPGALNNIPITDDFITGPLIYNNHTIYSSHWLRQWRGQMLGVWSENLTEDKLPKSPIDIPGMGCGCFATRTKSWLGFNPRMRGFGGEEFAIHEKYRQAGRRVICLPSLIWLHQFGGKKLYPLQIIDRVINYLINWQDLGLDTKEIETHFGAQLFNQAKAILEKESPSGVSEKLPINSDKLISALCITYGKPHLLEEAISSFLQQDYPNKELIILNDLPEQELVFNHPQVKVYNYKQRFQTIGEKRNECVKLSKGEILTIWDDDDISLPHRISQIAEAFNNQPDLGYFKPEKAWCLRDNCELQLPHINSFWAMSSCTKKAFDEVGGYKPINVAEDTEFFERIIKHLGPHRARTVSFPDHLYAFLYGWRGNSYHLSNLAQDLNNIKSYIMNKTIQSKVDLLPHWKYDYLEKTKAALK